MSAPGKCGCELGFRAASPPTLATQLRAKAELGSLEGATAASPLRGRGGRRGGGGERGRDFPRGFADAAARGCSGSARRGAAERASLHRRSTAEAEGGESVAARRLPAAESPYLGGGDAGRVSEDRAPTPPQFPGSRDDKGVHLSQPGTRKMKPGRLPDHQAVPEGSGPLSGYGATLARRAQSPGARGRRGEYTERWLAAAKAHPCPPG